MLRPESFFTTLLLIALVAFGPLSTDLYLPALPAMGEAMGVGESEVQLTLSIFLFGFAGGQLVYGPLSDRFGRRPVLICGIAIFTLASIACAMVDTIEALIAARLAQAIGACAGPVLGRAIARDVYGRNRATGILAYMGMAMSLAPMIAPAIGGVLTRIYDWHASFWLLGGIGGLILLGVLTGLPETNRHRYREATNPVQILRNYAKLLSDRLYVGYLLIVAFTYAGIFVFISGSSFVLITRLGLREDVYGLAFGAVILGYTVGSFSAGRLARRFRPPSLVAIGAFVQYAAGLAAVVTMAAGHVTLLTVILPFSAYMLGTGFCMPGATAGAIGPFPRMAGTAAALVGFCQLSFAAVVGAVMLTFADLAAAMAYAILILGFVTAVVWLAVVRHDDGHEEADP